MHVTPSVFGTISAILLATWFGVASAANGLESVQSPYSAQETMDRLVSEVEGRNLKVFGRIDHAAGAKSVGMTLRPTELLIFGNPKAGTPLMECAQSLGIGLPVKALVWEDEAGQVWLGWNAPTYLAERHGAPDCAAAAKMAAALDAIANSVIGD